MKLSVLIAELEPQHCFIWRFDGWWQRISIGEVIGNIIDFQTDYTAKEKNYTEVLKIYIKRLLRDRKVYIDSNTTIKI